ncbi:azurin [Conchiformibius steedae DSM 2580]|uniref:Azurin n=1 Tax=Conchiformibius steedae DSM 2580 TaxID=1121352 RepID=A0AAE9HSX4_9NEIS|nr:azurin [Conchiformibius steedae]QMT34333.1 azurin [Conchiformibius steedae]URD67108.1 azurin [Conchiformibius steedae DSM 2580]
MKTPYISLMIAAALSLSACGGNKEETPQAAEQTPPPAAVAPAASSAAANIPPECTFTLSGGDDMKFDSNEIKVKSGCKEFAVTLKHSGKQPKQAMGHNLVISKAADKDGITADGTSSGVDNNYLKSNDERVLASTKLLGGGEEDTLVLNVSKLNKGEEYVFFCTFPGHASMMNGKVVLAD